MYYFTEEHYRLWFRVGTQGSFPHPYSSARRRVPLLFICLFLVLSALFPCLWDRMSLYIPGWPAACQPFCFRGDGITGVHCRAPLPFFCGLRWRGRARCTPAWPSCLYLPNARYRSGPPFLTKRALLGSSVEESEQYTNSHCSRFLPPPCGDHNWSWRCFLYSGGGRLFHIFFLFFFFSWYPV